MTEGCLRVRPSEDIFSTLSSQPPRMATLPASKVSLHPTSSRPQTAGLVRTARVPIVGGERFAQFIAVNRATHPMNGSAVNGKWKWCVWISILDVRFT